MNAERLAERERAVAARARSTALRARALDLRERAFFESDRIVRGLTRTEGYAFGDRADGLCFRLPRLPGALGLVRHELRRWLDRQGIPAEAAADITLACSEACANAMEHPRGAERPAFEVTVRLRRRRVEVVVKDFGSWEYADSAEGEARGRGLDMIRALMDEVTIAQGKRGTKVTMRRRVDAPA
jgi:anti-sigma regulatory factor (Ser/Thr protein kinase)